MWSNPLLEIFKTARRKKIKRRRRQEKIKKEKIRV
jgi:hypothetical protein